MTTSRRPLRPPWMDRSYTSTRAAAFRRWRAAHDLQWAVALRDAFYAGYDLAQPAEIGAATSPCLTTLDDYRLGRGA